MGLHGFSWAPMGLYGVIYVAPWVSMGLLISHLTKNLSLPVEHFTIGKNFLAPCACESGNCCSICCEKKESKGCCAGCTGTAGCCEFEDEIEEFLVVNKDNQQIYNAVQAIHTTCKVKTHFSRFFDEATLKGAPNARSHSVKIEFLVSCESPYSDYFVHIGESVKLGLVWQTKAFEFWKNSFS